MVRSVVTLTVPFRGSAFWFSQRMKRASDQVIEICLAASALATALVFRGADGTEVMFMFGWVGVAHTPESLERRGVATRAIL